MVRLITTGGLDADLRDKCLKEMTSAERAAQIPGYAIGGLSGGEEKTIFWQMYESGPWRIDIRH